MKIVKFTAMWCMSCIVMNNILDEILSEKSIEVINYDYDIDKEMVNKYQVKTLLPVLIILDDSNNETTRITGEKSKKELISIFEGLGVKL